MAWILAVDFLHVDTVLLKRIHVLVFIEHGTRRMHIGGVTASPTGEWTMQQARNLALSLGDRLEDIKFLIRDRGPNFTASFDAVFQATGTRILRTAVQAPRMKRDLVPGSSRPALKAPRASPDDLAAELNPHEPELNPHEAAQAASRARTDHRGFARSGQRPSARQLAKAEPSRRLRSAAPTTLRYGHRPS